MSRMADAAKFFRRLRPVAAARSLGSPANIARNRESYKRVGLRRPPFAGVRHSDVAGRGGEGPWLDGDTTSAEIRAAAGFAELPESAKEGVLAWPVNGYLTLGQFFGDDVVDSANQQIERLLDAGGLRFHARSPRVMNSYRKSEAVAKMVAYPELRRVLDFLLGRRAELFQTISFIRGSEQKAHSDAFHMMTEPAGLLLGVWVALEDVDEGSGPVFYLPGSHRLPYVMSEDLDLDEGSRLLVAEKGPAYVRRMQHLVATYDREPVPFTASKGDVLIWHHNLLHGGQAIARQGATRRSLVAHFFAERALCYHEVTERPALMPTGAAANPART